MRTDSTCTLYGRDGEKRSWSIEGSHSLLSRPASVAPTIAAEVSITEIMSKRVVCAGRDLPIESIAHLMVHHHVGCIPIVNDGGRPVGIVTKLDLVEHFDVTAHRKAAREPAEPQPLTATDVMMPLAITLDERATVADAAAMFVSEDFHHIMIVSTTGALIGVVSTKDVVHWLADNDRAARTP